MRRRRKRRIAIKKAWQRQNVANFRAYKKSISEASKRYNQLKKLSPSVAKDFLTKIKQKTSTKMPRNERNKAPKNAHATGEIKKAISNNIKELLNNKSLYNVKNLKNYQTAQAAHMAGVPVKRNKKGMLKADLSKASKTQKNKYRRMKYAIRHDKDKKILEAMGAYEKAYGPQSALSNSDEVMENIQDYFSTSPDDSIYKAIQNVYADLN